MASPSPVPTGCSVEAATRWCLEHLDAFAAVLVGVEAGTDTADFHIVPLATDELLDDVTSLAIPESWHTLVVVVDGPLLDARPGSRIGLGVDRTGATHIEGRSSAPGAAQPRRGRPVA